jgi:translocator protein
MHSMTTSFLSASALFFPLIGGLSIASSTKQDVSGKWYSSLKKPSWTPPRYVFPVAWTTLYLSMGVSSLLVLRHSKFAYTPAIGWYGIQLALNYAWTPLFFKMHKTGLATVVLGTLIGAAGVTAALFYDQVVGTNQGNTN